VKASSCETPIAMDILWSITWIGHIYSKFKKKKLVVTWQRMKKQEL
tara:strand:- start:82 stop:219 length:138 start_codon:yes stop_codon:yes gene_type:complete